MRQRRLMGLSKDEVLGEPDADAVAVSAFTVHAQRSSALTVTK